MTFNLDSGHEYIQLNQLLKLLNLVESGGEANQVITAGEVMVNNQTETQKRKKLKAGDIVLFNGEVIEIKETEF
jgi:ribosome-associated protein